MKDHRFNIGALFCLFSNFEGWSFPIWDIKDSKPFCLYENHTYEKSFFWIPLKIPVFGYIVKHSEIAGHSFALIFHKQEPYQVRINEYSELVFQTIDLELDLIKNSKNQLLTLHSLTQS